MRKRSRPQQQRWRSLHRVETIYDKGIKVLPTELEQYHPFWQPSDTLPKWDITIVPG